MKKFNFLTNILLILMFSTFVSGSVFITQDTSFDSLTINYYNVSVDPQPPYLYTNGTYMFFNESKLNATVQAQLSVTDTRVEGAGYLYNDSTFMYLNESLLNATIDARQTSSGNTTQEMINAVNNTALNLSNSNSYFWDNLVNRLITSVNSWFSITAGVLQFNETRMNNTIIALDTNESVKVGILETGLSGNATKLDALKISHESNVTKIDNNAIDIDGLQSSNTSTNIRIDTLNNSKVNRAGDTLNGIFNYTDSVIRLDDETNLFIYDINDESHHFNVDLQRFDELRANVFTVQLVMETFANSSGSYINISTVMGNNIAFVYGNSTDAISDRFPYNSVILELTEGNSTMPVLNYIHARVIAGEPVWTVTTSEPSYQRVETAKVLVGINATRPYAAFLSEDGNNGILKRIQRRFKINGLLYESGLDYSVISNNFTIYKGNFLKGVYDQQITENLTLSNDGFYLVRNDGTYQWYTSISNITQYSDGNDIGINKYYNIIWGITPYDHTGNLYAVVQKNPNTEYTSMINAYADNDNTLNVYPSQKFLKENFLPVLRTIVNSASNEFQILPNTMYAEDYRGGIAGGVSSGGGISESDPLSLHTDGSVTATGNFNWGGYSITNLKDVNVTNFYDNGYNIKNGIDNINLSLQNQISTQQADNLSQDLRITGLENSNTSTNLRIDGNDLDIAGLQSSNTTTNNRIDTIQSGYFNLTADNVATGNNLFSPPTNNTFLGQTYFTHVTVIGNLTILDVAEGKINSTVILQNIDGVSAIILNGSNPNDKLWVDGDVRFTGLMYANWNGSINNQLLANDSNLQTQISNNDLDILGLVASNTSINLRIDGNDLDIAGLAASNISTNLRITTLDARELADNTTQAGLINAKASPGNCGPGEYVMNTTTGGVQCKALTYTVDTNESVRVGILETGLAGNSTKLDALQVSFNNNVTRIQFNYLSLLSNVTKIDSNAQSILGLVASNTSTNLRIDSNDLDIAGLTASNTSTNLRITTLDARELADNTTQNNYINSLIASNTSTNLRINNLAIPTYSDFNNQNLNTTASPTFVNLTYQNSTRTGTFILDTVPNSYCYVKANSTHIFICHNSTGTYLNPSYGDGTCGCI